MSSYEFILSLNILDISQDLFFLIQYSYPSFYNGLDFVFMVIYDVLASIYILLITSFYTIFNMKMLNSAVFNMGIKFILLIALLVFVRGGIPRYRFDFLTKIGWIKFLSLILSVFLSSTLLLFLF